MSTTVVGACILGALLHGHEALRTQPEIMEESADDSMMSSLVPRPLVPVSQTKITQQFGMYSRRTLNLGHPTSTDTKVIPKLLSDSWLSSRKCISEGPDEATSFDSIFECTECGQTAHKDLCTPPRKYEEHNFKPIQADASRLQPSSFRKELLSALPMQVAISGINIEDCEKPENVDSVLWNDWKTRISECLPSEGSDNEYRFAHLDRSHVWTAHYKSISGKARVELQISRSSAEWQLYVEAPPRKGALRDIFTRPVARLRVDVNEGSFLAGTWEFRNLSESFVTLAIEASGSCYPSWKSKLGLKKFEDEVQFEKLTVTLVEDSEDDSHLLSLKKTIEGTYLHLPKCGNACGSLHKKQVGANEENVYFFLESGRRTLPTDDVYVFAPTSHRTEYMEYREIYLELEKKAQYRPNFAKAPKDSNERTKKVKARILGQWVPLKDSSIQAVDSKKPVSYSTPSSVLSAPVTDDGWKFAPEIISCDVPLDDSDELLTKCVNVGVPQDINVRKSKHILRHLSFVTSRFALPETFQQQQQQQEEEEDEVWLTLDRSAVKKIDGEDPVCTKCAPKQPRIRWTLVRRGTKQQYCPIEDWKDAAAYEAALKSRPTPWNIRLSVIEQESDSKKLRIQIGCNAFSLCQRAFGRFPTDTAARKAMIQLSDSNCNCVYEWRVIPHLEKSFGDFPKLRFTSNKGDPYAEQPSNFKLQLRPEQRRSLSWMLKQERTNAPYFEEEIAESILPNLEWRAEGRVRRPVLARGGIIADEVGYGKTCITLALIDENQTPFSELQRDAPSGRIPTKATLIIVPGHLIGQWPEEVKKFLGNSKKVIVIKDMTSFNSMTIADVQEADIVLVNFTVLCSDKYFQRLARLSGKSKNSVPTGKTANRHFESVYKECLTALPNRVEQIKNDCSSVFDDVEADAANCRQAEQEEDVDFRLDGKKAVYKQTSDSKKVKKQEKQKKEAEVETNPDPWNLSKPAVKKDFTKMTCPPLEIFHFGRTVIDEFTYLLEKADRQRPLTLVRRGLSTRHRWLLSGTPNHSNFADVRSLAGLLGIHLGVDEPVPGTKMSKKDNAESTGLEAMANFAETQSFYWHERRHRKAQEFLDRFVRQNIAEIDEIPYQEHEELVQLSSAERAIYLELETVLRALEMNHSSAQLSKKKSQSDRESRIQAILNESKSAEEALVKCASSFNLSGEDTQSAARTCQDIIHFRMAQKKNLEQEMVDFIAAALRQRARIDSLQEGWSALTKAETGEMLDAVGPYLSDVERSESISHGADDEIHARVRELVALAQRNAEESPNKVDCVFAAVNDADDDDDDIADERPAKKKKGDSEEKKIDRLFNMKYQLRNHVHRIRSLGKELCGRVRSLRYIEQIRSFQNNGAVDATCPGCGTARLSSENAGILSCCGHIGCLSCLKKYAGDGNCVNERSCSARVDPAHIVPAANLGSDNDGVDEEGAKLSAIVRKIKEIIDGEDRIIIFVQFDDLKDKVIEALDRNEIKSVQVKGTVDKQVKALAPFVKPTPAKSDPRVLLLKMDSECSSGLNLTNLNHAIFVHPLLASSQQQYEAYETQAIGRIRRFG